MKKTLQKLLAILVGSIGLVSFLWFQGWNGIRSLVVTGYNWEIPVAISAGLFLLIYIESALRSGFKNAKAPTPTHSFVLLFIVGVGFWILIWIQMANCIHLEWIQELINNVRPHQRIVD